jgi:hypothetical protein
VVYVYNVILFNHKEELKDVFVEKLMELGIMLSKIQQTQKDKYHRFFLMWDLEVK